MSWTEGLVEYARRSLGAVVRRGPPVDLEDFARRTDPDADVHPETGKRLDGLPIDSISLARWNAEVENGGEIKLVPRDGGRKE